MPQYSVPLGSTAGTLHSTETQRYVFFFNADFFYFNTLYTAAGCTDKISRCTDDMVTQLHKVANLTTFYSWR